MDKLPGVSIIVPAYKRAVQTKKTLDLLLRDQNSAVIFTPQVIVVDASPDDSIKKMLSSYTSPYLSYVKSEKNGIAAAKNTGAGHATFELLIFCDSDMEVESDTIGKTLDYLRGHKTVAMAGGQVIWKGGDHDGHLDRPRKEDRQEVVENTVYAEALYSRYIATYKSLFEKVGGYDEVLFNMRGEGSDLSIRYWRSGLPLGYDENIRVHHVEGAEVAVTRHVEFPERGILRDLIQLGFKYGLKREESSNFAHTLKWLSDMFPNREAYIVIESMISLLPYFWENKEKLEKSKVSIPHVYDFTFLDVFTKRELLLDCVNCAGGKIEDARLRAFGST